MVFDNRYNRNINTFSHEENQQFHTFKICVVGCGGLGGYIIELLARLGIGNITAVDGDIFDETNLNRQILCTEDLIGKSKAEIAKDRMALVNSEVKVKAVKCFLDSTNCSDIIKGHQLVIDALDNITARLTLAKGCEKEGIPLVHGAIAGWYGQVAVIMPNNNFLEKLYFEDSSEETIQKGVETELGNPSFTPAFVASLQVSEAVKLLLAKGEILSGKLLTIDLLNHVYEIFEI